MLRRHPKSVASGGISDFIELSVDKAEIPHLALLLTDTGIFNTFSFFTPLILLIRSSVR